jgi:hypothetical protein
MSRFFLLAVVTTLWIQPLATYGEDAASGGKQQSLIRMIRPVTFQCVQPAESTLNDQVAATLSDQAAATLSDQAAATLSDQAAATLSDPPTVRPVVVAASDWIPLRAASYTASSEPSAQYVEAMPTTIESEQSDAIQQITEYGDGCCETECYASCGCGSCCGVGCHRGEKCCCRMPQHYPYYPAMHGYYYFRPYHHSHIEQHAQRVAGYGDDPRNPYANEIFARVYENYEAERQAEQ